MERQTYCFSPSYEIADEFKIHKGLSLRSAFTIAVGFANEDRIRLSKDKQREKFVFAFGFHYLCKMQCCV